MNCFDVQDKMIDLVLGELTSSEELKIREHVEQCPMCSEELQLLSSCIKTCLSEETEACECHFQQTYWENFVVTIHKKIIDEKMECRFPFRVVIPIAASGLLAAALGYLIFFRPSSEQTVQEVAPPYYEYDPYDEMDGLSPEETEEFIRIIDQKYGK